MRGVPAPPVVCGDFNVDRDSAVFGRFVVAAGLADAAGGGCTPTAMGKVTGADTCAAGAATIASISSARPRRVEGAEAAIGYGIVEFGRRQAQHAATPGGHGRGLPDHVAQHDLGQPAPVITRGRRVLLTGDRPRCDRGITRSAPGSASLGRKGWFTRTGRCRR